MYTGQESRDAESSNVCSASAERENAVLAVETTAQDRATFWWDEGRVVRSTRVSGSDLPAIIRIRVARHRRRNAGGRYRTAHKF